MGFKRLHSFVIHASVLFLLWGFSSAQSDCNNNKCCSPTSPTSPGGYTPLNEPRRSINSILQPRDPDICDSVLTRGWYKFTSFAGGKMPTKFVGEKRCGTLHPIWMDGDHHPKVHGITVDAKACIHYLDFCITKLDIKVRKCNGSADGYFVYHLEPTYRCPSAYCAGDKTPCPYEQIGQPPNCQDPKSCTQLLQDGVTSNDVYTINPDGGKPIQVMCDMTTDGGGWTVFQRRLLGSVDFYREWASYKNGFGDLYVEFWLGNDNLHRLTASDNVTLRVDLEDFEGNITYAEYTIFKVADEVNKYQLLIGGYNGTSGDSMAYQNGMQFSTKDNDNDRDAGGSCATRHDGAWWYNHCHYSNLNGLYLKGHYNSNANGVAWKDFRGYQYSLERTEMKVKPN